MFSVTQIEEILKIIDYHFLFSISTNFGTSFLSDSDIEILKGFGFDIDSVSKEMSLYDKMFLLGRVTSVLSDPQVNQLEFSDFLKFLKTGQYAPLTKLEQTQLEIAKRKTYTHLKGLKERAKQQVEQDIISREQYDLAVKEEIEQGVAKRKSLQFIVSDLGHRVNTWEHDWGRIVDTEMNNIFQKGRLEEIKKEDENFLVYKTVYPGACRHCIELYLTAGIGSQPRLFTIEQLEQNGSNVGRKVVDWKATVEGIHPFCFSNPRTPIYTSNGYKYIKDIQIDDLVLTHKGRFRKVTNLIFSKRNIDFIYSFICKLDEKRTVTLHSITGDHPILVNGNWIKAKNIKIGQRFHLLQDRCSFSECNKSYPLFYRDSVDHSKVDHCSVSCKSFDKSNSRTKEERILLTEKGRLSHKEKYGDSPPICWPDSKIKANRANGKKCTFIELKLRHFLDSLNIEYKTDFAIKREEKKSNNQFRFYFPDIYIPSLNIVIEADGINWHDIELDKKRDIEIKRLIDADTFRFTEYDIRNNGEKVFEELSRIIKNHRGEYSFRHLELIEIKRKEIKREVKLYNFSVEEDESYIANGFAVHNCRCHLNKIRKGYVWNKERGIFEPPKEFVRKVERKSKVKINIGDKEFLI